MRCLARPSPRCPPAAAAAAAACAGASSPPPAGRFGGRFLGRKEGAAGRQRGTTSTTSSTTHGRTARRRFRAAPREEEEGEGEELPPARAHAEEKVLLRGRARLRKWMGWGGVGVERWGVAVVCGVLGRGTRGRGAISATSAHGLGRGKAGKRRRRQAHKRGRRRTRRGARLCASEGVGRERLVPLVCMRIPPALSHSRSLALSLALSLSLWRASCVLLFVNIASKLVASFDLRRVRTSPHGRGAEGRRDSGAG